jgi:hypothetical protein
MKDDAMLTSRFGGRASLCALAIAISACGDGGGTYVAAIPPSPVAPTPRPKPTPAPTPTPTASFFRTAPVSQEFTVKGATFSEVAFPKYDGPLTADSDQLRIRYDAGTGQYEILGPQTSNWRQITPSTNSTPVGIDWTTAGTTAVTGVQLSGGTGDFYPTKLYDYSALVAWYDSGEPDRRGVIAFGVATDPSGIPVSGSATFNGSISGYTTETWDWADWGRGVGFISGDIKLTFDFGAGSLAGSISPVVWVNDQYKLPSMAFVDTVYSKGGTAFSGKFETNLVGPNAFSGLFTGPQASELIGNFVFPYASPQDGKTYEAGGGFIAKKP